MTLLVATTNEGKLREIRGFLAGVGVEVRGLADVPAAPVVVEDEDTFVGNARKKAWALCEATGLPALADDSGLVVEALGGRPGVWSARFAGPEADDEANNCRLLRELEGVGPSERGAAFVCAMVLAVPGGREHVAEGRLEGRILEGPRGVGGFGYDPLFLVEGGGETLAELELAEKNLVSHRAKALAALLPVVVALGSA